MRCVVAGVGYREDCHVCCMRQVFPRPQPPPEPATAHSHSHWGETLCLPTLSLHCKAKTPHEGTHFALASREDVCIVVGDLRKYRTFDDAQYLGACDLLLIDVIIAFEYLDLRKYNMIHALARLNFLC